MIVALLTATHCDQLPLSHIRDDIFSFFVTPGGAGSSNGQGSCCSPEDDAYSQPAGTVRIGHLGLLLPGK